MAGGISGFFVACLIFLSRRIVQMHDAKIIEIIKNVEKLWERVDLCENIIDDGTAKILLRQHEHLDYVKDNYIKTTEVHKLFDTLRESLKQAHADQNKKLDYLTDKIDQLFERDHGSRSADKK